jgi:hypothetical protein
MSRPVHTRERLLWGAAVRSSRGNTDMLITMLWELTYKSVHMPSGTAMPTLLFESRAAARAWCREHNAIMALSSNNRHLRARPVRVVETVRAA